MQVLKREKPKKLSLTKSVYDFFSTIRGRLGLLLLVILVPILIVQTVIYRNRFDTLRRAELKSDLEMARAEPGRWRTVDGGRSEGAVQADLQAAVAAFVAKHPAA